MIEPCGDDCPLCEADELARKRYLARHQRYNLSRNGQARNRAYEARHPERKLRWEPARNAARNPNANHGGGGAENQAPAPGIDGGGVAQKNSPT